MFGSQCNFFTQDARILLLKRRDIIRVLTAKGYAASETAIYLEAYDYFCMRTVEYDGATIVKDLCDIIGLDLDAMLHDYHYIVHNAGANVIAKFKADWMYAKGMEKKGKGQISAFSRFIALTIIGIGFVPYAYFVRKKISFVQDKNIDNHYKILVK